MAVCRSMAKSFCTVLDPTKLPAPVWRCSSEKMASSASGRCKADCKLGATAATHSLPHYDFKARQPVHPSKTLGQTLNAVQGASRTNTQ